MTALSTRTASVDTVEMTAGTFLIPVNRIRRTADHRKHSQSAIQALAEDIAVHGQRSAIEVVMEGSHYRLIFGALRLDAVVYLNRAEIKAEVKRSEDFSSEASMRLVSISENMVRRDLTMLERSVAIADWCAIYRAAQPGIRPGPKSADAELSLNLILNSSDRDLMEASGQFAASFSEAAQSFLGVSRAGVFRALKIASISSLQRERITLHPLADNQSELLAIAAEVVERQAAIIDLILGGRAASVADATALLDERPRPLLAAWEKFSQSFARMGEPEQDRFFELNEPAITRWLAKKGK
ncbi:hypothetical protein ACXHXM_02180